jgi:chromosome segregation ATPase
MRVIEVERNELLASMEETESAVEIEEAKTLRVTMELSQIKSEMEKTISDKDEEMDSSRRNATRTLETIQAQLDSETRARSEAVRIKKKLEGEISDIEIQVAHSNRQYMESSKQNKDLMTQVKDVQIEIDATERVKDEEKEQLGVTERRINLLQAEVCQKFTCMMQIKCHRENARVNPLTKK